MTKNYTLLILLNLFFIKVNAQIQQFGKADTADLKMKSCDFEKGANAEVLFDHAFAYYRYDEVVMERHKRIKIITNKGMGEAKIRIEFYGAHKDEDISGLEAQTINLDNKIITYTPVDKKSIYLEKVDRDKRAIVFTFPNVRPGSIIEYKYTWRTPYAGNFPDWIFQDDIPTRYSEFQAEFSKEYTFKLISRVTQKFKTDTSFAVKGKNDNRGIKYIWALNNVHSLTEEPYMTAADQNIQTIWFQVSYDEKTWLKEIKNLLSYDDFGGQLDTSITLAGEREILGKINSLKTADDKIAYIFNTAKSKLIWDDYIGLFTDEGIKRAWNSGKGNATEINLIMYHFLKKAGLNAYPLAVKTDGWIETRYVSLHQLDKTVICVYADSTKKYILDATGKDNVYNEVPFYLLNSNGLLIDPQGSSKFIILQSDVPAKKAVLVDAEITTGNKIEGTAEISCQGYNRISVAREYKDDGEKKYTDELRDDDNSIKISSFRIDNTDTDTLPLVQHVSFVQDLTESDDHYIYFSPNLFTGLYSNPFLNEERYSDIDFKYLHDYSINGRYKIPKGFSVEALPKNTILMMQDSSIIFKRLAAQDEGHIVVRYLINFKRSYYRKSEYETLRAFYKKMKLMLDEQIILKKT